MVPLFAHTAVGVLAATSVTAAASEAAALAGRAPRSLDPVRVAVAYTSERWLRIAGAQPTAFAPLSGFFRTLDGWVRTHGNYPHHASALRAGLGLSPGAGKSDVAVAVGAVTASEATRRITGAGGLCSAVRAERPDVDEALREVPVVSVSRIGSARPTPMRTASPAAPLEGVRVLDLTRVIAGPVATRTLALLGADVLRIDSPRLPELSWQHLDTGHGKRSCLLDLASSTDRAVFDELLASADVVVLGYRPSGLDRLGLTPHALAERRPGLIVSRLSAWGAPDLRGFDSLVQAASGISILESPSSLEPAELVGSPELATPGALPAQALDHSAGYLLAAETMRLLRRRAAEGGSWLAETSLRRIAAELLGLPRTVPPSAPVSLDASGHVQEFDVDGERVVTTAPAIAYDGGPDSFAPPRPWGRDRAEWLSRPRE